MSEPGLTLDDLETVYDQLARAIDQAAASDRTELFLTKLVLLQAHALGSAALFEQHLQAALRDL